jgi:threonyl-tRNA synthetase
MKVPYMIIIGDKEKTNNTISVRAHKKGDIGTFNPVDFIYKLEEEKNNKTINS